MKKTGYKVKDEATKKFLDGTRDLVESFEDLTNSLKYLSGSFEEQPLTSYSPHVEMASEMIHRIHTQIAEFDLTGLLAKAAEADIMFNRQM